jgi:hypothetical protein
MNTRAIDEPLTPSTSCLVRIPQYAKTFIIDCALKAMYVENAFPRLEAQLKKLAGALAVSSLLGILASALLMAAASAQDVAGCPTLSFNNVCLTTYQGGISRLGYNPTEPILTQAAITATTGSTFHKLFSIPVNGAIYAQPLVLPNVTIGSTTYDDVAYVATEQNWVYAIDGVTGNILWSTNLSPTGYTFLQTSDVNGCPNILPSPGDIGVTGTPVIDLSGNQGLTSITSGVLYVVAKLKTTTKPFSYKQTLYALSVINGGNGVSAAQPYASIDIGGTFNGITFNQGPVVGTTSPYSKTQNQRGALLAVPGAVGENPQIVMTWGAHCDHTNFPYNGWMMAYQLNSALNGLTQTAIWASIPAKKTYEGGIWQGGSGPAADINGHIYLSTGNGDVSVNVSAPPNDNPTSCTTTPCDYGNSILQFQISGNAFSVLDFFTTYDWVNRNKLDYDLGSGGLMLLPSQEEGNPENLLVQSGKEGTIYLTQTTVGSMGGYTGNGVSDTTTQALYHAICYNTAQECGIWGSPAWWDTTSGGNGSTGYAYFGGKNQPIKQFQFYPNGSTCTGGATAGFCTTATASTSHTFQWPGPIPTVTAESTTATQAIVWAIDPRRYNGGSAALWAFDAATLNCLYTTDQTVPKTTCTRRASSTDVPAGIAVKFSVPSIANGNVYVGTTGLSTTTTQGFLSIYGIN